MTLLNKLITYNLQKKCLLVMPRMKRSAAAFVAKEQTQRKGRQLVLRTLSKLHSPELKATDFVSQAHKLVMW